MKKKIELPSMANNKGMETFGERRTLGIARAIAKRAKLPMPDENAVKKNAKGKGVSVELDLTQKQIDELPIGLKKLLK